MMKFNINKIHGNLLSIKEMGDSVSISEKSDKKHGSHFEIVAEMHGKQLKMIVRKNELESDSFSWSYYADPTDADSHLIERVSTTDTVSEHILDIFEKSRFDEEYLSKIAK
jgi:hypothetical protein